MKIDDHVEQCVRETLHWVVKRKPDEFQEALKVFSSERMRRSALELLTAIVGVAVIETFGQRPSDDEIGALAAQTAHLEEWSSVTDNDIAAFLKAIFAGEPLAKVLPAERIFILAFVIAGSVLSAHPKEEGVWWFNYLDKVEAVIESN